MATPKKKLKPGRRILLIVIILLVYLFTKRIPLDAKITIEQGENVSKIFNQLSTIEKFRIKYYLFTHRNIDFSKLEAGSYTFSGSYTKEEFIQNILKGSEKDYIRVTILEGRSIYDIDEALTRKGYSNPGEYISYVSNPEFINQINRGKESGGYDFLNEMYIGKPLQSLEGFLYPDTYNIDKNKPVISQLVTKQLQTFQTRVRNKISSPTNRYKTMILASILEKEERNNNNKPTVAGIFLKRLEIGMKIDADITLCYGLKTSYTACTPTIIGKNVGDKNNIYNTRQVRGLPPTPISNPTRESIHAVTTPQSSDYLYYLHDMQGNIHYGSTLDEHNANKVKYLN